MAEVLRAIEFHSVAELIQKGSSPLQFDPAGHTLSQEGGLNGYVCSGEPAPKTLHDLAAVTQRLDEWGEQMRQQMRQLESRLTELQRTVAESVAQLSASVQVVQEKERAGRAEPVHLETFVPVVQQIEHEIQDITQTLTTEIRELGEELNTAVQTIQQKSQEDRSELLAIVHELWQDNAALRFETVSKGQFWAGVSLVVFVLSILAGILFFK
jgi:cell division protein ZapA (FtsZ GTPase activity inhibitor)